MPPKHILNAPTKLMKELGYFEGYIEADSANEAEDNFHESDIQDITILTVYKDEEEDDE